jgi:hypothetical protein
VPARLRRSGSARKVPLRPRRPRGMPTADQGMRRQECKRRAVRRQRGQWAEASNRVPGRRLSPRPKAVQCQACFCCDCNRRQWLPRPLIPATCPAALAPCPVPRGLLRPSNRVCAAEQDLLGVDSCLLVDAARKVLPPVPCPIGVPVGAMAGGMGMMGGVAPRPPAGEKAPRPPARTGGVNYGRDGEEQGDRR